VIALVAIPVESKKEVYKGGPVAIATVCIEELVDSRALCGILKTDQHRIKALLS